MRRSLTRSADRNGEQGERNGVRNDAQDAQSGVRGGAQDATSDETPATAPPPPSRKSKRPVGPTKATAPPRTARGRGNPGNGAPGHIEPSVANFACDGAE